MVTSGNDTPETEGTPPSPPTLQVLHAAEHALEAVEVAARRAEDTLARRLGARGRRVARRIARVAGVLGLLAYFAAGLLILGLRYYVLPNIDHWRPDIERAAGQALHAQVSIGRIESDWQGLRPRLLLWDVNLRDEQGSPVLALPQVDAVVGWLTVVTGRPHLYSLAIDTPEVEVRRLPDHRIRIAGVVVDPSGNEGGSEFLDWLLAQRHIAVRDAHVRFVDEAVRPASPLFLGPPAPLDLDFLEVNVLLQAGFTGHRFALQMLPPASLAGPVDLRGEISTPWSRPSYRLAEWSGHLFTQMPRVDFPSLEAVVHLLPPGVQLARASGAMRAWADFSAQRVERVRADVSLQGVDTTLRADLAPLQLDALQGRFTLATSADATGESHEYSLQGLVFQGPRFSSTAPTDLQLRLTRPIDPQGQGRAPTTRLQANRLVLGELTALAASVPLPPEWIRLIGRTAAQGTVENLVASWEGSASAPVHPVLQAGFRDLGASLDRALLGAAPAGPDAALPEPASPALPAPTPAPASASATAPAPADEALATFDKLTGRIEIDGDHGNLRIDPGASHWRLPGVFEVADLSLDRLAVHLNWTKDADGTLQVRVDSASAANADFDIEGSGGWRSAAAGHAAQLDVDARIGRGSAPAAWRYVPRQADPALAHWLQSAVLEGRISGGSFHLHGDPARLPFVDAGDGTLEAELPVDAGRLEFAPSAQPATHPVWPDLTGVNATVRLQRSTLRIDGRSASAYGFGLSDIAVRIEHLERADQHLVVDGSGYGPLAQALRYVGDSPVNASTGGWMAGARASGPARLRLHLDVPLAHSIDTTVEGSAQLIDDDLVLRPDIAPFSALTGKVDFNQQGVRFSGLRGGFLGGEMRADAETRADGTIAIHGAGTATPQGARRQIALAPVRRMLDHARGNARYRAAVLLRRSGTDIIVDADLAGLAIDLPEPLRKAAAEPRSLHFEDITVPGSQPQRDRMRITVGPDVALDLERTQAHPEREGEDPRIDRGVLAIGASTDAPDAGLLLAIDQPHLDVDRWIRVLGAPALDADEAAHEASARPADLATQLSGVDYLTVHAGELSLDGKAITQVYLGATRQADNGWLLNVDADQASGSVLWVPTRDSPGRVSARLARLVIPDRQKTEVAALLDAPPTSLPELDIQADQFDLGGLHLGQLDLQALNPIAGHGESWLLQKLAISNPDGRLTGSGQWQRDSAGRRVMNLRFSLNLANGGGVLGRFGLPGYVRNAPGKLEGELSWAGSPLAIDYPTLSGRLHLQTEKGQFLKVGTPAGGRLLGVLSLQSVSHRLTGDFRDVFSDGFAFDSIVADANVAGGRLTTDNFIMQGVNAKVRIEGSVDLQNETQQLRVVVLPSVNVGGAALVTAFINPALGLTTFLADLLLRRPIEAGLTNDYEITGTWADPQVHPVPHGGAAPAKPATAKTP